ncbi:MAG: M23 family metallopeptidase [Deltaproteobacteria bacterium]|nr:M23 family metallopeptidase [Deltaproteobacteria bacterium]
MNKKLSLSLFLGLFFFVSLFCQTSAKAEKEGFVSVSQLNYEIFYAPENLRPGQALVVALRSLRVKSETLDQNPLKMNFIEREFSLRKLGDGWQGVAAVPLGTRPGSYKLSIKFKDGAGLVLPITVFAHDYGEQRLTVPKEMATPMLPENLKKINRDRQNLRRIYASSGTALLLDEEVRPPLASKITSPFGLRRLFNGKPRAPHGGIDFRAAVGVPIVAAAKGRVALAEELYYSGNLVIIDHGLDIFTLYMHLDKISCCPGDIVHPGQIIGTVGSSGRVTGPHLHWGVKVAGVFVDPLRFVTDSKHLLELPWEVEKWQK